jgi:hypothetical protein
VICDPRRERIYFNNSRIYDLVAGNSLGVFSLPGAIDDLAFDKRGYLHCHFNPGFNAPGVGRLDPGRGFQRTERDGNVFTHYPECPYDYGVEAQGWGGVMPVRDQPGGKFFQDGIGVNMQGDVAEVCNIYHVPKMELVGDTLAFESTTKANGGNEGALGYDGSRKYAAYLRDIQNTLKEGLEVYSIKRRPGIPLSAGTIWTFDRSGELRQECAANLGEYIYGVGIDEDGALYFTAGRKGRTRLIAGRAFLDGQCGMFGAQDAKSGVFTNTFVKTKGRDVYLLLPNAPVPLDQ